MRIEAAESGFFELKKQIIHKDVSTTLEQTTGRRPALPDQGELT